MIYGVPIVMANRVGSDQGLRFWGGSQVVDPFGAVVVQGDGHREELLCAKLDYEAVRQARFQLPTLRDSNRDLVHREIAHLAARPGGGQRARRRLMQTSNR
jgi:N-carbamoylputrescine amidase